MKTNHTILALLVSFVIATLVACGPKPTPAAEQAALTVPAGSSEATATPKPMPTGTSTATAESAQPAPGTVEDASPTPTPTPTAMPGGAPTVEPATSPCEGLSGEIETQVLVGPSDAVGLEPLSVGQVPFAVTTSQAPYLVEGAGHSSYSDVLTEQWGTYAVTLELDNSISGECVASDGGAELNLELVSTGEQMVAVDAGEFQGEYPWSGTNTFDLNLPVVEGASVQGEGYTFVLHLAQP